MIPKIARPPVRAPAILLGLLAFLVIGFGALQISSEVLRPTTTATVCHASILEKVTTLLNGDASGGVVVCPRIKSWERRKDAPFSSISWRRTKSMTTYTVDSASALNLAIKSVKAGDVILLSAGTYSDVDVKGIAIDGNVTISSKDPGNPAIITDIFVSGSKGFTFSNLELATTKEYGLHPYQIVNSENVSFDKVNAHGTLDNAPRNDPNAFLIDNSKNVSITNSEFHEFDNGIIHLDSTGLTISGNKFHDIGSDGIHGAGSSNVLVSKNFFTDFYPSELDHPDAIQFFTRGAEAASHDIVVIDNVVVRGNGAPIEGVFFRDQMGNMPFENVTISNNLIVGALWDAITVLQGNNVTVTGNKVFSYKDQDARINVSFSTNAVVEGNTAVSYIFDTVTGLSKHDNGTSGSVVTDAGKAALDAWLAKNPSFSEAVGKPGGVIPNPTPNPIPDPTPIPPTKPPVVEPPSVGKAGVSLTGSANRDFLEGGDNNDTLSGGAGDDIINARGGWNVINGGDGEDAVTYASATTGVTVNLGITSAQNTGASTDTLKSIENLTGSSKNDVLIGNDEDNMLAGGNGNDLLIGGGGDDLLYGGLGDDTISGGAGYDTASYADAGNGVKVSLAITSVQATGLGNDKLEQIEDLTGSNYNDTLTGDGQANVIKGGIGNDVITGGVGADVLHGGTGADTFVYTSLADSTVAATGRDSIYNFSHAEGDRIDLRQIDAVAGGGDTAFTLVSGFTKAAGQLVAQFKAGTTLVQGDVNGDGVADFAITVTSKSALVGGDFML